MRFRRTAVIDAAFFLLGLGLWLVLVLVLAGGSALAAAETAASTLRGFRTIGPSSQDRILVVAPHSDDETLGAGGFLHDAVQSGAKAYVALVTNGDGFTLAADREFHSLLPTSRKFIELGYKRQGESLNALRILGVARDNVFFLGYPDRGMAPIWEDHWTKSNPYLSRFTQSYVNPYFDSYQISAVYSGEDVVRNLEAIIQKLRPTIILTAAPVDAHPDHWATYNFTLYAVLDLEQKGLLPFPRPRVLWYLVHRGDWPYPRGLHPGDELLPPESLLHVNFRWLAHPLSDAAVAAKAAAVRAYRSQMSIMAGFLLSFVRADEVFAEAAISSVSDFSGSGLMGDGGPRDWDPPRGPGVRLLEEPIADSVIRKVEGGGDFASLTVGKDRKNLYLGIGLRSAAAAEVVYTVRLHPVGIAASERGSEEIDLILRMQKRRSATVVKVSVPEGATTSLDGIAAVAQGKNIELTVPLALVGTPRKLFLAVESSLSGVMIDRTTWWVLSLTD